MTAPMPPGLHTAALDYSAIPSEDTSSKLVAASLRASIAELQATGEIVPRSALLLLSQLAEQHEDPTPLPPSEDDDDVAEPTGILRLPVPPARDEF